ncbi:flavodoxin family protein [Pseudooceanicola onchidii]|uniref:flavodoxin family protein n=1 Tax=Pseudooceanicola onchidii TaxID=2562279 RepID=UPI0010AAD301|nr:flavodoxin family protein [Pseudooceanicola onchidii]
MIAIAYFSGSGAISHSAELIGEAARAAGVETRLIDVATLTDADWATLAAADAILFGTPTYMGGPAAGFKAFMDATGDDIWLDRKWRDKIAGGFTAGVNTGGDKLATLQALNVFAMQHGMIWVGQDIIGAPVFKENDGLNLSGTFLGLAVNANTKGLTEGCKASAKLFGERVAGLVKRLQVGNT